MKPRRETDVKVESNFNLAGLISKSISLDTLKLISTYTSYMKYSTTGIIFCRFLLLTIHMATDKTRLQSLANKKQG